MKRTICILMLLLLAAAGFCPRASAGETSAGGLRIKESIAAARGNGAKRLLRELSLPENKTKQSAPAEPYAPVPEQLPPGAANGVVRLVSPYTYGMLERDLGLLKKRYPAHFDYGSLGATADGREIYCLRLGSGNGSRQIVSDVAIHGSEYLNPPAVMYAVEYYLKNYDTPVYEGFTVRELLRDTDLYIIPMLNPDGVTISQSGPDALRDPVLAARVKEICASWAALGETDADEETYYRIWKANANGVDLNRNYLFEHSRLTYDTGVYRPADAEFAGVRVSPEAETAAFKALVNGLSNPVAALSIHSQGELIYWNGLQSAGGKAAARALALTVAGVTGYELSSENSFVGAAADWVMIEKGVPAVTVETGGGAHNPLPAGFLPAIAAQYAAADSD